MGIIPWPMTGESQRPTRRWRFAMASQNRTARQSEHHRRDHRAKLQQTAATFTLGDRSFLVRGKGRIFRSVHDAPLLYNVPNNAYYTLSKFYARF
jgi:hypothetical protein